MHKPRKILVCDDSEICCEMVKMVLEERGHEVVLLDTPFGFGSALLRERPDLVLLDVAMPALPGDKLFEIAKRHVNHTCPIVFFSDRSEAELKKLVEVSGAAGFITKTSDTEHLAQMVEAFLPKSPK